MILSEDANKAPAVPTVIAVVTAVVTVVVTVIVTVVVARMTAVLNQISIIRIQIDLFRFQFFISLFIDMIIYF